MFGSVIGNALVIGNPPNSINQYAPIKGPVLRLGTIPSLTLCPQVVTLGDSLQIHDGGLASDYTSGNVYWIGPDGQFIQSSKSAMPMFSDIENTIWGGGWFDPLQNAWASIPGVNDPSGRLPGTMGYTTLVNGNFRYGSFYNKNLAPILNPYYSASPNLLLYTPGQTGNVGTYIGNWPFNMSYGGVDTFIVNSVVYYGTSKWSAINVEFPIGDSINNGPGVVGYAAGVTAGSPQSVANDGPYIAFSNVDSIDFQLSYMNAPVYYQFGKVFITGCSVGANPTQSIGYYDANGNLHYAQINETSTYSKAFVGRLWNGFVYKNVFSDYSGCCYTEDLITFYPMLDITGNVDFTNNANFGTYTSLSNFSWFMTGFGFGYLANYYTAKKGAYLSQAAYKIYPAFNFSPMIPDSFFIPSVCGCNRRSNRA